jgi:16S rRNA (cytosine967-C5)-methyltransferase
LSAVHGIAPSRKTAFDILLSVERGKAHSDELLRGKAIDALSPADRNLVTTLVLGVLRWQIRLDTEIKGLLKKPNAKLDAEILIALRLGAFQVLFLERIPAHAAIDESVELAKQAGHHFAAGMVNAVLRRIARGEASALGMSEESPVALALAQAHPAWMVERWAGFYGLDAARAICRHGQERPLISLRVEDADAQAELELDGICLGPGALLTDARTLISGDVTVMAAYQAGRLRIQDEGSQLIGELAACAGCSSDQNPKRIVDLCAAPGGKTIILAERNPEAQIVACESNARRLNELRKRVASHASRVECRLVDVAELREESTFDVALADVPCSGTGTLGRNPEIRHRLRIEDLSRYAGRQEAILRAALRAVRPGGFVVYSTCSLEPEENEQVVAALLSESRNARQGSLAAGLESLLDRGVLMPAAGQRLQECLTHEGALRLPPGVFQTDGFFIALIERTA